MSNLISQLSRKILMDSGTNNRAEAAETAFDAITDSELNKELQDILKSNKWDDVCKAAAKC